MTFYYEQLSSEQNADGSTTVTAGASMTTALLAPTIQTGAPLPSTTLPEPVGTLPFAGSAWNTAIPGSPTLDPNSAAIVANLVAQWNDTTVGLNEITLAAHMGGFGAYYLTGQSEPTSPVEVLSLPNDNYRNKHFSAVPVPPQAVGTASLCSAIGVWQPATHTIWELIEPAYSNGWFAQDAATYSDTGAGTHVPMLAGLGFCGISLWALTIKVAELQAGVINHALALSLPYVAPGQVNPAGGSNGMSSDSRAIQTGIKFQLIPGTNISAMSALGQVVATAIENYGAYVISTNQNGLSLLCEDPGQYKTDPYIALYGTRSDSSLLNNMPVSAFRVILHP